MFETQILIYYNREFSRYLDNDKRQKMDNKDKYTFRNIWSKCERMIYKEERDCKSNAKLLQKLLERNKSNLDYTNHSDLNHIK